MFFLVTLTFMYQETNKTFVDPTLCQRQRHLTPAPIPPPIRNWGLPTGPTMGSRTCSYCDCWSIDAFEGLKKDGAMWGYKMPISFKFQSFFCDFWVPKLQENQVVQPPEAMLGWDPTKMGVKAAQYHKPLATLASTIINQQ